MASISLVSDYDRFHNADIALKRLMIVENIFKSLGVIKRRLKENFAYEFIKNDIMKLLSSHCNEFTPGRKWCFDEYHDRVDREQDLPGPEEIFTVSSHIRKRSEVSSDRLLKG